MSNTKKIKNNIRKSNKSELNLNVINQANENLFTTKTVIIPVGGKDYSVEIQQVFRTTKIEKMVSSLVKSGNLKQFTEIDESVKLSFYMYLIIREFTNLDIPNNLSFEQEINLISSLIDLGIFELLINEIPESEVMKVNDYLQKFNMNLNQVLDDMNKDKNISEVDIVENDESGGQVG